MKKNSSKKKMKSRSGSLRPVDIVVLVFFLFNAVLGLYLFRHDLLQTIEARDVQSIGYIIIKNNVVQRRFADRVIWERLFVDSPVYIGDLIRAAELSSATIHIDENQINLNENTLVRISQHIGGGQSYIDLQEGNLDVITGEGSGIVLNLMGRQVVLEAETSLNAEHDEEGIIVRLSEGAAVFVEDGVKEELSEGTVVAQDKSGKKRVIPSAVVTSLKPKARYLKSDDSPLPVDFGWKSSNIEEDETVRLEIAEDRRFTKNLQAIEGVKNHALAVLDAGSYYWRLALGEKILNSGQITVADASGPQLLSPVMGSVFRYRSFQPLLRFQWEKLQDVSHYLIEINNTQNFDNPRLSRQVNSVSYISGELGEGTWYWRVKPVFLSVYEGESKYSEVFSLKIEKTDDPSVPLIEIPEFLRFGSKKAASTRRSHTVKSGDTLGNISLQYYGDFLEWKKISEANDIENPDLIYPEQEFIIP